VRVIDLLVVHKNAQDVVERLHRSDLTAGEGAGAVVGALTGLDAAGNEDADGGQLEDEFWSLDEAIRNNSAATIALVEHRRAIGTRDAIPAARGFRSSTRGSTGPTSSSPACWTPRTWRSDRQAAWKPSTPTSPASPAKSANSSMTR
jgi:hypothetical protein